MNTEPTVGSRRRSDAVRNLERVMAAASELLIEADGSLTMKAVADRAGVGIGTVYRMFPNKHLLFEYLLSQRLELMRLRTDGLQEWEWHDDALVQLLGSLVRALSSEPVWRAIYRHPGGMEFLSRFLKQRLGTTMERLLHAEQALARVTADIEAEELIELAVAIGCQDCQTTTSHLLTVVFRGLQAEKAFTEYPLSRPSRQATSITDNPVGT